MPSSSRKNHRRINYNLVGRGLAPAVKFRKNYGRFVNRLHNLYKPTAVGAEWVAMLPLFLWGESG